MRIATRSSHHLCSGLAHIIRAIFLDAHLESIAQAYIKLSSSDYVRTAMCVDYGAKSSHIWVCDKTRKAYGTVERDFRITYNRGYTLKTVKLSGLTVVSRGLEVLEIRNLI